MKRKRVWVVSVGDLTGKELDCHILGVYSSRKNAVEVQKVGGGKISRWPLNPYLTEISAGKRSWSVAMDRDGQVWVMGEKDAVEIVNKVRTRMITEGKWFE